MQGQTYSGPSFVGSHPDTCPIVHSGSGQGWVKGEGRTEQSCGPILSRRWRTTRESPQWHTSRDLFPLARPLLWKSPNKVIRLSVSLWIRASIEQVRALVIHSTSQGLDWPAGRWAFTEPFRETAYLNRNCPRFLTSTFSSYSPAFPCSINTLSQGKGRKRQTPPRTML